MANFMQTLTNFESSCVRSLSLDKELGEAKVEFINGNKYNYYNVSKYAIKKLLATPTQSIGKWVNVNLVNANTEFEYA